MIPKILHFSVPAVQTPLQKRCIEKARELHPDWQLMVWSDPVNPAEFQLACLWDRANSGAQLADLIRIEVVRKFGGVYLDSDVLLRKPLDHLAATFKFFVGSEDGECATNAVFGAVPEHPALVGMVESLLENQPDWSLPPYLTTGPEFFSRILRWRSDVSILPRETFYPFNWNEKPVPALPQTYGIHEWAASWKTSGQGSRLTRWLKNLGASGIRSLERLVNPRQLVADVHRRAARMYRRSEIAARMLSPRLNGYAQGESLVRATIYGYSIILDGKDVSITPELMRYGFYELREELFFRRHVRGGDWVVDVGANVGMFSLLAASLVGPFGRVFAYEPNPRCAQLLRKSGSMNWMHDRISVREFAVGSRAGKVSLRYSPSRLGDGAVNMGNPVEGAFDATVKYLSDMRSIDVPLVTLDEEFPCDVPIKALKIDAEGNESEVLAGARRLLASHAVEYVMLEALPEVSGSGWPGLIRAIMQIMECGYKLNCLGRNGCLEEIRLAHVLSGQGLPTRNLVLRAH